MAFTLKSLRILKDQKLDVCRGLTQQQVIDVIQMALEDYDRTFQYIGGPTFVRHNNS